MIQWYETIVYNCLQNNDKKENFQSLEYANPVYPETESSKMCYN